MAIRQRVREEDYDERSPVKLSASAPASKTFRKPKNEKAFGAKKTGTIASKKIKADAFSKKELRIEPIYPDIKDSPGQIDIGQLSRHARAVEYARWEAEMAQAREMREARRSEPMPELKGRVVYARRDREKEERLQTRQTPQHHTVPFTHSPAQEHYTNDGMISELELERQAGLAEVISPVKLPAIDAIPAMSAKAGRITRAQILRAWLMQWVKRISAILSRLRGPRLTKTGKQALAQLQRLYSLVSADYGDDSMEMVQLRVAFGEAYFHMMQASHRHHKHSRGRGKEDYGAYFDQFLRGAPE